MTGDPKRAQTKITYATMSADRMEDLHRELDRAIEQVRSTFGASYPLLIDGREIRSSSEFDDRSPIDTRLLLGRFQNASREQVRDAMRRHLDVSKMTFMKSGDFAALRAGGSAQ